MALQNSASTATFGSNAIAKYAYSGEPNIPASWFYGGVQFPLAATSANSMLQDADPALFYALDFYTFVLNQYLGARWSKACSAANFCGSDGNILSNLVSIAVGYNPGPFLTSGQFALPILAIYRVSSENRYKTVMKSEELNTWELVHVLPPMDASAAEQLLPIQHAIGELLDNRTEQGFDPAYTPPGGSLGQQAWQLAGLEEIQCVSFRYELYDGVGALPMPVLIGRFLVKERQGKYIGFQPFQGASVTESVFDPTTNTTIADIVEFDTWVPIVPTL